MYLEQLSKIAAQFEEFDLILYQAGGVGVRERKRRAAFERR